MFYNECLLSIQAVSVLVHHLNECNMLAAILIVSFFTESGKAAPLLYSREKDILLQLEMELK